LQVSFLAPAKTGLLTAEATVVQIGKTIGFIEGKLTDADGVVVAKATASARLTPTAKAVA
jgi:acyl-coenzyme A thioesterase PaaI-like protein